MARLLMISPNLVDDPYPVYPLGADLVASAARKAGHDVNFCDLMVDGEKGLISLLKRFKPEYIAFSMRNVDNVNYDNPQSFVSQYKIIIDIIKSRLHVPIILGGSAYTIFPVQFLEFLGADYGITGPGEISLPKLLAQLEQKQPPLNRVIHGEIDYSGENDFYLTRERHLAEFYLKQGGMLNISTKRGCPHHCMYCSYPSLEGNRYVFRQAEAVADEIEYLTSQHQADFIFFTDSVFNDSDHQYLSIVEEMVRRKIAIPWSCYMRPAKFDPDEVKLLKQSGLYSVEWGSDCSCDLTLAAMGKNLCWEDVREAHNLFARNEIPGSHFIIFGGPGETHDTVRQGVKNLAELNHSVIFGGTGIRIFPNTGIFELAKKIGLVQEESELFHKEVYFHSPDIDVTWVNNYLSESFRGRRNWVFPWAGVAERNRFMHNSGLRGPLWDLLLQ